jgi:hypothetical protein
MLQWVLQCTHIYREREEERKGKKERLWMRNREGTNESCDWKTFKLKNWNHFERKALFNSLFFFFSSFDGDGCRK